MSQEFVKSAWRSRQKPRSPIGRVGRSILGNRDIAARDELGWVIDWGNSNGNRSRRTLLRQTIVGNFISNQIVALEIDEIERGLISERYNSISNKDRRYNPAVVRYSFDLGYANALTRRDFVGWTGYVTSQNSRFGCVNKSILNSLQCQRIRDRRVIDRVDVDSECLFTRHIDVGWRNAEPIVAERNKHTSLNSNRVIINVLGCLEKQSPIALKRWLYQEGTWAFRTYVKS